MEIIAVIQMRAVVAGTRVVTVKGEKRSGLDVFQTVCGQKLLMNCM